VLAYTAGLTYVRGEELLLTLEGWHRVHLDLATREVIPQLLLGGPHHAGLALLARYHIAPWRLTLQLHAQLDLAARSFILAPQASFRWGDHLGLVVGAQVFEGAAASLGGRLDRNDQLFVGVDGYL